MGQAIGLLDENGNLEQHYHRKEPDHDSINISRIPKEDKKHIKKPDLHSMVFR